MRQLFTGHELDWSKNTKRKTSQIAYAMHLTRVRSSYFTSVQVSNKNIIDIFPISN